MFTCGFGGGSGILKVTLFLLVASCFPATPWGSAGLESQRRSPSVLASELTNDTHTKTLVLQAVAGYQADQIESDTSRAGLACSIGKIIFSRANDTQGEYIDAVDGTIYTNRTNAYWFVALVPSYILNDIRTDTLVRSSRCWLPSRCIVAPKTSHEVGLIVKVIAFTGTRFAVRSGGHNPNPAWASIGANGLLVDLYQLDTIRLSGDRKILTVGPGNRWADVYRYLNGTGISVAGARVQEVGVGGQLLGGE
ncbi:MAG: hypothetical protein Q9198_000562 [Flavoplaca austrocitrina]